MLIMQSDILLGLVYLNNKSLKPKNVLTFTEIFLNKLLKKKKL
jgi:hypothetical protein